MEENLDEDQPMFTLGQDGGVLLVGVEVCLKSDERDVPMLSGFGASVDSTEGIAELVRHRCHGLMR